MSRRHLSTGLGKPREPRWSMNCAFLLATISCIQVGSASYSPRLLLRDPEISRFPLLLTEPNIVVMSTNELIAERLET